MKNSIKVLLFFFLFLSMSCDILENKKESLSNEEDFPPPGFKESDVVGVWENDNNAASSLFPYTEVLVFRDDHTFTQIYTDRASGQSIETIGTWYVKSNPGGCAYVYTDRMQYYELGMNLQQDSDLYSSLWDYCENRAVDMHEFVLLNIGNSPAHNPPVVLFHMAVDMESTAPFYWQSNASPP